MFTSIDKKRGLTAIALILIAVAGIFANGATDAVILTGVRDTLSINPGAFSSISVSGIASVDIIEGDIPALFISGDQAAVETVQVSNENGLLVVSSAMATDVAVTVITPVLNGVMLTNRTVASIGAWDMATDLSIVLSKEASLTSDGALNVRRFTLMNNGGAGADLEVHADSITIDSNSGKIVLKGQTAVAGADLRMNAGLVLDDMTVHVGYLTLANTAEVDAKILGITMMNVETKQDASANLLMNGSVKAAAYHDSSITASGNITASRVWENDDSSISVG